MQGDAGGCREMQGDAKYYLPYMYYIYFQRGFPREKKPGSI